jgi:hypothetical protein
MRRLLLLAAAAFAIGFLLPIVSVSSGSTPSILREATLSIYGTLNVTRTDAFNVLRSDEWWIALHLRSTGGISMNTTAADLPYKVEVNCKSPPCRLQVFLPFGVSGIRSIDMPYGDATYSLAGLGNGTIATITLDEPGGAPFNATITGWVGEYHVSVADYKGRSRDAELRLVYADGTEAVLTPGTHSLPIYPVTNMSWGPAGRLTLDPDNTACRRIANLLDSTAALVAPPAFGRRCELRMLYVLGTSLRDVSASPQIGGLYRVDGRLVDEEGEPVPGRRILVFLQGNLTGPAETVTGPDGRFSALFHVPPSNRTRLLTVRFPGEPALTPSSKVLEIPGTAPTTQVPWSAYAFLVAMIAAFVAVIARSLTRASRRAQAIYRSRRALR